MLAADAPGKLPPTNSALAGSFDSVWKLIDAMIRSSFAQVSYCVKEPPMLRLCEPFSQLTVSSSSRLLALRDCGRNPPNGAGPVRADPTLGKFSSNPWYESY